MYLSNYKPTYKWGAHFVGSCDSRLNRAPPWVPQLSQELFAGCASDAAPWTKQIFIALGHRFCWEHGKAVGVQKSFRQKTMFFCSSCFSSNNLKQLKLAHMISLILRNVFNLRWTFPPSILGWENPGGDVGVVVSHHASHGWLVRVKSGGKTLVWRFVGFHSHGGIPIAGWFISWKILVLI